MKLSNLGPNVEILKSPSNWFLVTFAVALLVLGFYFINHRKEK